MSSKVSNANRDDMHDKYCVQCYDIYFLQASHSLKYVVATLDQHDAVVRRMHNCKGRMYSNMHVGWRKLMLPHAIHIKAYHEITDAVRECVEALSRHVYDRLVTRVKILVSTNDCMVELDS